MLENHKDVWGEFKMKRRIIFIILTVKQMKMGLILQMIKNQIAKII
jgi:hypothetical protein